MIICRKCHSDKTTNAKFEYKQRLIHEGWVITTAMGVICLDCGFFKELGDGWANGTWATKRELDLFKQKTAQKHGAVG